jgi:protein associated with RNAse G/E
MLGNRNSWPTGQRVATSNDSEILVRTYKYDGHEHRSWRARVIKNESPLLILDATFEEDIEHSLLGKIASGTLSTEYYWLDRWYNVFRFSDPNQELKSFYCNINLPPTFDGELLKYVDLDIDVLVQPDLSLQVLDLDDFEANAKFYSYPAELRDHAHQALAELINVIETHSFPFDRL